ncbi:MAG: cytochrome c3 family protein [Thermoanaerobacteraceae bacterium]|nr:cytochrome c3 family protein [Thermoanaerobacteraceae bacterium]
MRKVSILLALCLFLACVFATAAFAEQAKFTALDANDQPVAGAVYERYYSATPKSFNPEGTTNYPFEIYLPNEARPDNYRIHTNYTKDTDACASCHATHTAVGESLLQWYSVYDTCMACHDGTVSSTYNVQEGQYPDGSPLPGGMFGTGNEAFLSNHNVTGAVTIAAAPGGSTKATKFDDNGNPLNWSVEFGCESCHSPHGQGGNARILNPNPNNVMEQVVKDAVYVAGEGYAVPTLYPDGEPTGDYYYFLTGYPYNEQFEIWVNGTKVDKPDYSNQNGYTVIKEQEGVSVKVYGVPSLKVKFDIANYLGLNGNQEQVTHVKGINVFCGACHTDYNTQIAELFEKEPFYSSKSGSADNQYAGSGHTLTGIFSEAYRHQVGIQWDENIPGLDFETGQGAGTTGISCLTCHVAHGTSQEYWYNSLSNLEGSAFEGWDFTLFKEITGSSALKRMPNMGTCEACHHKGKDNEGYWALTGQEEKLYNGFASISDELFNQGGAKYVGLTEGKCLECHEEHDSWQQTKHFDPTSWSQDGIDRFNAFKTANPGYVDDNVTCEACHLEGSRHVKVPSANNITNPANLSGAEVAEICGQCHNDTGDYTTSTMAQYGEYKQSPHYVYGVATCNDCHSSHGKNSEGEQLQTTFVSLCSSCHSETKEKMDYSMSYDHTFGAAGDETPAPIQYSGKTRTTVGKHSGIDVAYVEANGCTGCHDDEYEEILNTAHYTQSTQTDNTAGWTEWLGMLNRF